MISFKNLKFNSIVKLIDQNSDRHKFNPRDLLIDAVSETREIGSSTCIITTLDEEAPMLYTANLGDSGYLLLRKEGIDLLAVYKSKE